jgi:hypothetical protein
MMWDKTGYILHILIDYIVLNACSHISFMGNFITSVIGKRYRGLSISGRILKKIGRIVYVGFWYASHTGVRLHYGA